MMKDIYINQVFGIVSHKIDPDLTNSIRTYVYFRVDIKHQKV